MTFEDDLDLVESLLNVRVRFWTCPDGHSDRQFDEDGGIVATVEWRDGVAYCLRVGCGRSSADERGSVHGATQEGRPDPPAGEGEVSD